MRKGARWKLIIDRYIIERYREDLSNLEKASAHKSNSNGHSAHFPSRRKVPSLHAQKEASATERRGMIKMFSAFAISYSFTRLCGLTCLKLEQHLLWTVQQLPWTAQHTECEEREGVHAKVSGRRVAGREAYPSRQT